MKKIELKDPPIIKLVNSMIVDLYDSGEKKLSFSLESPPSLIVDGKEFLPERDLVKKMINRLKIMSGRNPMNYPEASEGIIKIVLRGNPFDVKIRFLDTEENQSCWLEIK